MIIAKVNAQILGSTLNNHKVKADLFLLKAKKQKTAGWLVLGGGLALCFVSVANAFVQVNSPNGNYNPSDPPSAKITIEEIMAYGGAAAMLTSITLFIAS